MDCGTKRDWSTVPKQYRCGSRLVPWQDYFGTDTVLEFLLGVVGMAGPLSTKATPPFLPIPHFPSPAFLDLPPIPASSHANSHSSWAH